MEISPLTESDRADWEVLARGHFAHFGTEVGEGSYERTWQRLLDGQVRGIVARLDGKAVGIANYLFHASVWYSRKCYLADLFVTPEVRRRGIATAMLEWVSLRPFDPAIISVNSPISTSQVDQNGHRGCI
jgi:GNAT superfamily N-acetyltransferase